MLPRIYVVLAELGVVEGVSMVVVSVELWPGQVVVRVAARPGAATDRFDAADAHEIAAWTQPMTPHQRALQPMPQSSDARLLGRALPRVTDDRGTAYQLRAGQVGTTDHRWRAEWIYAPEPPVETLALPVSAAGMDVALAPVVVALH